MMKALVFKRYGGPDQVEFADVPRPTVQPDEILVQVHAVGLNPVDNKTREGQMKPLLRFQLPATLGTDLAGIVVEVGERVTRFKPGDTAFANVFDRNRGTLAEFAVVNESDAAPKPEKLDFVQAASIPMVGLTVWQAFKERVQVQPDQKVFIPAGAGGIGTFAIQLAKLLGAEVATTASAEKVDLLRDLGADTVIDYRKQQFDEVLRDYDVVLGTIPGDSLEKALKILKPKSSLVSLVGPPDPAFGRSRGLNPLLVLVFRLLSRKVRRLAKKTDVDYSFLLVHPDGRQLAEIGQLLDSGAIRPVIDRVIPFDQAKEALAYLDKGRAAGKVVVQMR